MHFGVGDFILSEMILQGNLIDLINRRLFKLVGSHINRSDVLVAFQGVFESGRVGVSDLIAADIEMADRLVRFQEFGE